MSKDKTDNLKLTDKLKMHPVFYQKFIKNGWKESLEIVNESMEVSHRSEYVRAFIFALNNGDLPKDAIEYLADGLFENFGQASNILGVGIGKGKEQKSRLCRTSFRAATEVMHLTIDLPDAADVNKEVFERVSEKLSIELETVQKYYSSELDFLRKIRSDNGYWRKVLYGL